MEHLQLQWTDVERHVAQLVEGLCASGCRFDRVIAVSRGGLIPAALVATRLGVKRVDSIQVQLYEGSTCLGVPRILGLRPASAGPSGDSALTLIVDEIVDSGATLAALGGVFPEAQRAALVGRRKAEGEPGRGEHANDTSVAVGEYIDTDCWVVFPWSPTEDRPQVGS